MKYDLLPAIITFLFACDEPVSNCENTCSVIDPIEELEWLRTEINGIGLTSNDSITIYFYATMANYNGNTVFMIKNCCPFCNTTPPIIKNCNGEILGYLSETEGSFSQNGASIKSVNPNKLQCDQIIWKPDGFACNVSM